MIENLTKSDFIEKFFNFDETEEWNYNGDLPCIMMFYSDNCVPCLRFRPTFTELAEEYKDKIIFYEINIDIEIDMNIAFDVDKVPTLIFVPVNGEPSLNGGSLPKELMIQAINMTLLQD